MWKKEGNRKYQRETVRRKLSSADLDAARDCATRKCQITLQDWVEDLRSLFWRLPKDYWLSSRDCHFHFLKSKLPENL